MHIIYYKKQFIIHKLEKCLENYCFLNMFYCSLMLIMLWLSSKLLDTCSYWYAPKMLVIVTELLPNIDQ